MTIDLEAIKARLLVRVRIPLHSHRPSDIVESENDMYKLIARVEQLRHEALVMERLNHSSGCGFCTHGDPCLIMDELKRLVEVL